MKKTIIPIKTRRFTAICCRGLFALVLAVSGYFVISSGDSAQAQTDHALNFSGDFRLRLERTTRQEPRLNQPGVRDPRTREVVRFRFGMNKKINGLFNFGARLATGSPDDPNTTDITLGDFVNDLTISLDRVYMEMAYKNLFLTGGKFANPFLTTELVWDGDVNLQGVGASYTFGGSKKIIPKITGVHYIIDEQTNNPDSYMVGGQMQLAIRPSPNLGLTIAGAYYDHKIRSLANAKSDDIASNNTKNNGAAYLSDFDLVDLIAVVDYRGFGERYPIRFVGDYVKNRGAAVNEDSGFEFDLYLGQASKKKDLRFQYAYAELETDGALAAFTHDNTTIATNYQQHTLAVDYVVVENTTITLTWYIYRRDKVAAGAENDFFSRLRLNALVKF